jgi:hypothetical protein
LLFSAAPGWLLLRLNLIFGFNSGIRDKPHDVALFCRWQQLCLAGKNAALLMASVR